ncbi:neurogenic locus notch 2 [Caerostris extrusa]|uniref:Neurogenic locus notch 2 n=1 Tax=Caerostris extrusa TaxID=172846 RepID=A0AAV4XXE4_CAEEX|nr:neurogenic locus notch 2 [Caerostris extrusa]
MGFNKTPVSKLLGRKSPPNRSLCDFLLRLHTGAHFRFFTTPKLRKTRQGAYVVYGSELALVENFWQNNYTQALAGSNLKDVSQKTYWLGLRTVDDLSTNTLESAGGSFISLYMGLWATEQPRPQDGSCVQASLESGRQMWKLTTCETLLPFMCQTEACPTEVQKLNSLLKTLEKEASNKPQIPLLNTFLPNNS